MPIGVQRDRILHGLGKARGREHRYTRWRWIVAVVSTLAVAALPLADILRFDFWGGRHVLLGEEVDFLTAAKAFAFPFLAVNILIVVASRSVGRYLCGFACPVGAMGRLGEWLRWSTRKKKGRITGLLGLLVASAVLSGITVSFWVDLRVFREGSGQAIAFWGGGFVLLTTGTFLATLRLGLGFCRDWCPSGVYFAVLGPSTLNGVEFAHPETCTDCKACEVVCPMDLSPTHMLSAETRDGRGFYPESLSSHALCIRCGDCVSACEGTTGKNDGPTPLRLGWLHSKGELCEPKSSSPS